jgi:hypothetical protein
MGALAAPRQVMRIAYCGHSHHRVTGSAAFLLEALRSRGDVVEFWLDHWRTGEAFNPSPVLDGRFDAVVVYQVEAAALALAQAGLPNVTFFPMYDSCHACADSFWRRLGDTKVVSFSSTLHARLQRLGLRSRFAQYFPDPTATGQVSGRTGLAGYFWQRQQDVTWSTIRQLVGDTRVERFTLHDAMDPEGGTFGPPSSQDMDRYRIRVTSWFPSRVDANTDLLAHNVYFAPRLREGIGMSFLEAMAMGFLVVAPDRPTMNEYIVSGVNGLLYDPRCPRPLDFSRREDIGRRARSTIEVGHQRWLRLGVPVLDLIETPNRAVPAAAPHFDLDSRSLARAGGLSPRSGRMAPIRRASSAGPDGAVTGVPVPSANAVPGPLITVIILPGNSAPALDKTLSTVLAQDLPGVRPLVLESARGGTAARADRGREGGVDWLTVERGLATAAAMNSGAALASGSYLLFLRPGEGLLARDTLSGALADAPKDADAVIGHHVRTGATGDELVTAFGFEESWARLRHGGVGWTWLLGLPARPATLWLASRIREHPFREDLPVVCCQELLFRLASHDGRIHHSLTAISEGPEEDSIRHRDQILREWRAVAPAYSDAAGSLAPCWDQLDREARASNLHLLPAMDLLVHAGRVPGVTRELKRRGRTWAARRRHGAGHRRT